MVEEKKDLAIEVEKKVAPWRYRHFIEGVATEEIAERAGADPTRVARVFYKHEEDGADQVHIVGSADVVKEIADGMESPKRELHTWYIGEAETVEEEREAVVPALEELVRSLPYAVVGSPRELVEKALGLPLKAVALDEAAKALEEGGFIHKKEGGEGVGEKSSDVES